jgi:hypothetical protein
MKFLDLNGLKHLLKFMDRTVSVASSNIQFNSQSKREIPFITNHQIINLNSSGHIDVFNWFKGASEGGILEIVFAGARNGYTYCINNEGVSMIYKMAITDTGPILKNLNSLATAYNTYARFIKLDGKLIVAEFVTNR